MKANVKAVENAQVGRHQIAGVVGLYLHVGEGSARWLFRYHRRRPPDRSGARLGS